VRRSSLLLDTHVFLRWKADDRRLRKSVRSAIAEAGLAFVSAASAWEAGIRSALGRLDLPESLEAGVEGSGFEKLPVSLAHAEAAAALPPHHPDPFDRMLIARARMEGLTLQTHDRRFEPCEVAILWT